VSKRAGVVAIALWVAALACAVFIESIIFPMPKKTSDKASSTPTEENQPKA
jgi:hypothetical protein